MHDSRHNCATAAMACHNSRSDTIDGTICVFRYVSFMCLRGKPDRNCPPPHDEFSGAPEGSLVNRAVMITGLDHVRLIAAASALLLGTGGAAAADDVSRWDGDARSAARLIAGSRPAGGTAMLRAGIAIRLKPGWHTYWRYPGDAGVPPQRSEERRVGK